MSGWNFLGYIVGEAVREAFGTVGMKNITWVWGEMATPTVGLIRTHQLARYRNVVMQRKHLAADLYQWEPMA